MSHKRSTLPSVIGEIRKAWDAGRAIVPIVGAGFSADSGFPVLRSIVQYLAQIYVYLDKGGPFPSLNGGQAQKLQSKLWERYRDKPWHFVEDFGWPDRFQLHQDLQRIL